ncbi:hypothetical protein BACPU_21910 [Bacillus pumilus]|nr:hypothetical protein BACPU_21910 [Bacillus pumilus]
MVFSVGIIIAFAIMILGITVLNDIGDGLVSVFSILVAFTVLLITGRLQRKREQNDSNPMVDQIMMIFHENEFQSSRYFITEDLQKGFAIDEEANMIRIVKNQSKPGKVRPKSTFEINDLSLKDVLRVEVLEDDIPIPIKSSSENSLFDAGTSSEEVSKLQLRMTINDHQDSSITTTYIDSEWPINKNSEDYLMAKASADDEYNYIDTLLKSDRQRDQSSLESDR